LAHKIHADLLINASNVDGVYDSDPKKNPNAKKLDKLTPDKFLKILKGPGKFCLFDQKAIELLKEKNIKMVIINGTDPQEIIKAVFGGHKGTDITQYK
jgi:uridylate kinase